MKTAFAVLVSLALVPGASFARSATADSSSNSGANSQVILEGSESPNYAPGLGGVGGNSTAPCVIGTGFGIVGPGAGLQFSGGRIEEHCLTRTESAMLADLLNMPNSPGKRAAIAHACKFDKRLQETLVAVGVCVVKKQ